MSTPVSMLAVCLGNICRSPMAEGLLRHHIQQHGLRAKVDSAGTSNHHQGEPPDRRAQQEMKRHGIDISSQRSRPFVHADFETFDLILVMDQSNLRDVLAMAQGKDEWVDKVHLILDDEEIPDPYYGGASGFAEVFEMLDRASEDWVRSLKG